MRRGVGLGGPGSWAVVMNVKLQVFNFHCRSTSMLGLDARLTGLVLPSYHGKSAQVQRGIGAPRDLDQLILDRGIVEYV